MKQKIKSALILLSFLMIGNLCLGQSFPTIKIKGSLQPNIKNGNIDSLVTILISRYAFGRLEQERAGKIQRYKVKCDKDFDFRIEIPSPDAQFYIQIFKGGSNTLSWIDDIFIVNSGDDLTCHLTNSETYFSGEGKDKMNCQVEVLKNKYKPSYRENTLKSDKKYVEYLKLYETRADSSMNQQIEIVNKYKNRLDSDLYQTLIANCYGLRNNQLRNFWVFDVADKEFSIAIDNHFKNYEAKTPPVYILERNLAKSPMYSNYLFQLLLLKETAGYASPYLNTREKAENLFKKINSKNNGILKDKLFCLYSLRLATNQNATDFVDSITNIIKDPFYLNLAKVRNSKLKKNAPFYNFELKDRYGKKVRLSDFKDKTVFIDFWYTGCAACAEMSLGMSFVLDEFKNNDDVKFVTVSIDNDKDNWINNGIESGKYTHAGQVNLFTNGEGKNHPLIKYYNISAYPRLFLIKNGRMYSSSPPRPGIYMGRPTEDSKKLISLIREALIDK